MQYFILDETRKTMFFFKKEKLFSVIALYINFEGYKKEICCMPICTSLVMKALLEAFQLHFKKGNSKLDNERTMFLRKSNKIKSKLMKEL